MGELVYEKLILYTACILMRIKNMNIRMLVNEKDGKQFSTLLFYSQHFHVTTRSSNNLKEMKNYFEQIYPHAWSKNALCVGIRTTLLKANLPMYTMSIRDKYKLFFPNI